MTKQLLDDLVSDVVPVVEIRYRGCRKGPVVVFVIQLDLIFYFILRVHDYRKSSDFNDSKKAVKATTVIDGIESCAIYGIDRY